MADAYRAWRTLDDTIRLNDSVSDIERRLAPRGVDFINQLVPEEDRYSREIAHTLLYTAITVGTSDVVALLLLRGADPLQTVHEYYDYNDLSVTGERRIIRHNAMEACERTLRSDPRYAIFLLRLLDTRPVATADTETDPLNWLGRDVNAPLTHPDFPRLAHGKDNALEYACKDLDVYSVRWLLHKRKADPFAVRGGFHTLMRRLDENRDPSKQNNVLQIRALLNEWMAAWTNPRIAVGMAVHRRLGSASPLHTLPPDTMRLIARHYDLIS
jgi:hypothetical protein